LPRCIRALLHVNTEKAQRDIVHVYLREAKKLRPDMQSAQ
jgi:chorismate mutase